MTSAAALPRLCLVADGFATGRRGLDARAVQGVAAELVAAGLSWVWLRDHDASAAAFDAAAHRLAERLREIAPGVVLSVGTHLATARALGAHLHAGRRGDTLDDAGAAGVPAGLSAHGAAEVVGAARRGAVYATLSPVFPTASHAGAPTLGLDRFGAAARASPIPVLALGGMTPERAGSARAAGAWGAAVLSDLLHAPRPAGRLDQYLRAVADGQPPHP